MGALTINSGGTSGITRDDGEYGGAGTQIGGQGATSGGGGFPWEVAIPVGLWAGTQLFNKSQNDQANAVNAQQAALNREFQSSEAISAFERQKYLRSTAYQATMDDMRKAGLNPMLAFQQGATATPGAAQAGSVGNPDIKPFQSNLQGAFQAASLATELKRQNAEAGLAKAQAMTQMAVAQRETHSAKNLQYQNRLLERTYKAAGAKADWEEYKAGVDRNMYNWEKFLGMGAQGMGMARDATITGVGVTNMLKGKPPTIQGLR